MSNEFRNDGGTVTVHLEREFRATPTELWQAWTDPARLARWLGSIDVPLGDQPARMAFGDGDDDWADLTVLRSVEPELLELRWDFAGEVSSALRVQLVPLADGLTRVVLDHGRLGDSTLGYGAGWAAYLAALDAEVTGQTGDATSWDERFAAELPQWRERWEQLTAS